jgi:hypothetical protein
MQLVDTIFNWLQIQVVYQTRPHDRSAKDTVLFFEKILQEDHGVEHIEKRLQNNDYIVTYHQNGLAQTKLFPRVLAEKLLQDIISEPKYNQ